VGNKVCRPKGKNKWQNKGSSTKERKQAIGHVGTNKAAAVLDFNVGHGIVKRRVLRAMGHQRHENKQTNK